MEIQLQELIDQIRKDGVEAAENQAATILESAKIEADKIITDAKDQAAKIISDAKTENERTVKSGEDAIRQAGRNLLISFRESVTKELNAVIGENISSVYSSDALSQIIIKAVETWTEKPDTEEITVILSNEDLEKLENTIKDSLRAKMLNGVTLKSNDNLDGGFRIAVNGDGAYYDYSKESVTDMLSNYLSPRITALMKEAE